MLLLVTSNEVRTDTFSPIIDVRFPAISGKLLGSIWTIHIAYAVNAESIKVRKKIGYTYLYEEGSQKYDEQLKESEVIL